MQTPAGGMVTPSGMASTASTVPGGLETPDFMDLRKKREGTDSVAPASDEKRDLYTVVQERRGAPGSAGFLGSDRTYDLSGMANTAAPIGTLGQEDRGSKVRSLIFDEMSVYLHRAAAQVYIWRRDCARSSRARRHDRTRTSTAIRRAKEQSRSKRRWCSRPKRAGRLFRLCCRRSCQAKGESS